MTGERVLEGRVTLLDASGHVAASASLDGEGRFRFDTVKAIGKVRMAFTGPKHGGLEQTIQTVPGGHVTLIVQALARATVRVVDTAGVPVGACRVSGNRYFDLRPDPTTDAEGRCVVRLVPGPRIAVMARAPDGWAYGYSKRQDVSLGTPARFEVTLDRRLVKARVRVVALPGSEHLSGRPATLIAGYSGWKEAGRIPITVGGPPEVLGVHRLDGRHGVRYLGPVVLRMSGREDQPVGIGYDLLAASGAHVFTVFVEDRRCRVRVEATDVGGNPVRGLRVAFHPIREDAPGPWASYPADATAVSDERGLAELHVASGVYDGILGRVTIEGDRDVRVTSDLTTFRALAQPPCGCVEFVDPATGRILAGGRGQRIRAVGGVSLANLPLPPGTTLRTRLVDSMTSSVLAEGDALGGGPPGALRVERLLRHPHRTTAIVSADRGIVSCTLFVESVPGAHPRIVRWFRGQRVFDLSRVPPGDYHVRVQLDGGASHDLGTRRIGDVDQRIDFVVR